MLQGICVVHTEYSETYIIWLYIIWLVQYTYIILFFTVQQFNFQYYNGKTFSLPYDFESVMHYESRAFAVNVDEWTIRPHEQYRKHDIGQRKRMSPLDIARINMLYKCPNRDNILPTASTTKMTLVTDTDSTTSVPTISTKGKEKSSTESSVDNTEDEESSTTSTTQKALPPVKGTIQSFCDSIS